MDQTSFITSKSGTQSGKYSMHCINYANREQEKPLLFKLTLRSRFTLSQAQSVSCHELLVVFGLSTLNLNRTNHKPRKKKPIKNAYICPCDSAEFEHDIVHKLADALYRRFRASATQAIPANPSILRDRLLLYIENTIDTHGSSFYPGCKAIAIKNLLRPPITFRVSNQMNHS